MSDPMAASKPRITRDPLAASAWALFTIALVFYVARLIVRWRTTHRFYSDDVWAAVAISLLLILCVVLTIAIAPMYDALHIRAGLQQPSDASLGRESTYLKLQFASTFLFWTCLWSSKACFLAFLHRSATISRWLRRTWWIIAGFTLSSFIGCIITLPVACGSFEPEACTTRIHDYRASVSLKFSASVDIISGVMILGVLLYLSARTSTPPSQKIIIALVSTLSLATMIFAIIRITITNPSGHYVDPTWLNLWSHLEASLALITVCLLAFIPSLHRPHSPTTLPSLAANPDTDPEARDDVDDDIKVATWDPEGIWSKGHRRGTSNTTVTASSDEKMRPKSAPVGQGKPEGVPPWSSRPMRFMGKEKVEPREIAAGLDRVRRSSIVGINETL